MKPIIRRGFNALAVFSLLLCIATALLWVRSYWITDFVNWYAAQTGGEWRVSSSRGQFKISEYHWRGDDPPGTGENGELPKAYYGTQSESHSPSLVKNFIWFHYSWQTGEESFRTISLAGITWESSTGSTQDVFSYSPLFIAIPHWLVISLTMFAPARMFHRITRRRRSLRLGLCPSCDYDLRATPDRCPKCGTVPAKAK